MHNNILDLIQSYMIVNYIVLAVLMKNFTDIFIL